MLNDDIGTARRSVAQKQRQAVERQLQHEARAVYPSRLTVLLSRLRIAANQRSEPQHKERAPRAVRVPPPRRSAGR